MRSGWSDLNSGKVRPTVLILAVLAVWVPVRLGRALTVHEGWQGSVDYYTHWVAGLFLLQGTDPYLAQVEAQVPITPIEHLVGAATGPSNFATGPAGEPIKGGRVSVNMAVNTPPILLLQTPLSLLAWPVAKHVVLVLNLAMLAAIPALLFRWMEQRGMGFNDQQRWLVYLCFFGFASTAAAIGVGQPAIASLFFSILGVQQFDRNRTFLAGLFMGIALSKFPLALPFLGYLLIRKGWRSSVLALGVQALSFSIVGLISRRSPTAVVASYSELIRRSSTTFSPFDARIDVYSLQPASLIIGWVLAILLTGLTVWGFLVVRSNRHIEEELKSMVYLALAIAWSLLLIRHLFYDMMADIVSIVLLIALTTQYGVQDSPRRTRLLPWLIGLVAAIHLAPLTTLGRLVQPVGSDPSRSPLLVVAAFGVLATGLTVFLAAIYRWSSLRRPV